MKTWFGVFAAAWRLGHRPWEEIIVVAYNEQLAEKITYKIRQVMKSEWYKQIFRDTRISANRAAAGDFRTTQGGGVFATSIEGTLAGIGADLIIIDDPNKISDAQWPRRLKKTNQSFDSEILTRRNSPSANIMLLQHRIHEDDLSSHLLKKHGYTLIALPLIAPRDKTYQLSNGAVWHRKTRDLLRKGAYTKVELEEIRENPMFDLLFQQAVGMRTSTRIGGKHFKISPSQLPLAPRVMSIDAALKDGPINSYSVVQVWQDGFPTYHLLDQFREQCDFSRLEGCVRSWISKYNPSVILIENAANGVVLIERLKKRFPNLPIVPAEPGNRSKSKRLALHRKAIRRAVISLPQCAYWRLDYIAEFYDFPSQFTDQVDATTQFLDFITPRPALKIPQQAGLGAFTGSNGNSGVASSDRASKPDLESRWPIYVSRRPRFYR
jgi:phage terminase large subunit-like protein